jgi:hypothetical protein
VGLIDSIKRAFRQRHGGGREYGKRGRFYVYELADPRFEPPRVFYIGSGEGDRAYQHEKDTRSLVLHPMQMKHKHKRILEIWDDGKQVQYGILFRSAWRWQAYEVESEYIRRFGLERLSNETYGYSEDAIARARRKEEFASGSKSG